jgi:hypothetical protein
VLAAPVSLRPPRTLTFDSRLHEPGMEQIAMNRPHTPFAKNAFYRCLPAFVAVARYLNLKISEMALVYCT